MSTAQPDGYLAAPQGDDGNPVLVLHAWWGLNDTIKSFCDQLAAEGYLAFAPDLYRGKLADTIPDAEVLAKELSSRSSEASAEIKEAVKFLSHKTDKPLAVIGFSLGAYFALELSNTEPDHFRSVVIFYGTGPDEFDKSKASFLGHFAENDPYEALEYVEDLENAISEAGRPVDFHIYPNTGHWFFEADRKDAYDADAAQLAWERTLEFLKTSA